MNQLNSITYVNAASIPFAKVNLDGNTLMVGANGAGKTTVLRSALYFYGVHENSALGINIRKKKGFTDYYFHELNSFIAYRYSNSLGNVLVIAYRSGSSNVKFKFVLETEDINDRELFFDNNIGKSPEELWKKLNELGFSLSPNISKLSDYRNILYGNAGAEYKKYAFFNAKDDYNNFIHVLSNIFINSKLDASSIQKTISNAISGFEPIDLEQIDRSIDDFEKKYNDVTKFEANKGTVTDILHALIEYEQFNTQSIDAMNQLFSNQKSFILTRESLDKIITEDSSILDEQNSSFFSKKVTHDEEIKEIDEQITILKSEIKKAEKKLDEYKKNSIDEKLELYALKDKLETEHKIAVKKLEELTSTQSSLKEKFIKLREAEDYSYGQKVQNIDARSLTLNQEIQDKHEQIGRDEEVEIQMLNDNAIPTLTLLKESLQLSVGEKTDAYNAKIEAEHKVYLKDEISKLFDKSTQDKESHTQVTMEVQKYKSSLENLTLQIASVEKEKEFKLEKLKATYTGDVKKLQEKILEVNQFLNVNKNSLLGFIKEIEHPQEESIVALVKNDILLDTRLEPSFSGETDTFFGLSIDTYYLEDSNYSKENILQKIENLELEIKILEKKLKNEEDELINEFKNRLNELRRKHRTDKQLFDTGERKLPKLKSEYLKSADNLKELQDRAKKLQEEALLSTKKLYEESLSNYMQSAESLKSYEDALNAKILLVRKKANDIKKALKNQKKENTESVKLAKENEKRIYTENIGIINSDEKQALLNDGVDESLLNKYNTEIEKLKSKLNEILAITSIVQRYYHDKEEHFSPLEKKYSQRDSLLDVKKEKDDSFSHLAHKHKDKTIQLSCILESNRTVLKDITNDIESIKEYLNLNPLFREKMTKHQIVDREANSEKLGTLLLKISTLDDQAKQFIDDMRMKQDLLYRYFEPNNSLDLLLRFDGSLEHVLKNSYELRKFILDGKFEQFQEGVSSLFSLTINQLTKQTASLLEAKQSVDGVVNKIRSMLRNLEGISVINSIDLRTQESNNTILMKLEKLQALNDEYNFVLQADLFNFDKPKNKNAKEAIGIIIDLRKELDKTNKRELILDDTYALEIRASENGNDTGWQVSLDEVGSNGTDVMIKAIVNIAMLSISLGFKANSEHKTYFHCILDEIGVLHPSYLKELISYANNKHIRFLNGAPNRQLVSSFRRIYILTNNNQNTMIKPLLSKK
jgi:hypothetical protein